MTLDFGNVLTRAWQIVWKHKVLWIFGILAGCSRGGGSSNFTTSGSDSGAQPWPEAERFFEDAARWLEQNWWIIIVFAVAVLILVAISIYLSTISRIALIKGTAQVESGVERLAFGGLWAASNPYFWRVVGLALLIGVATFAIFLPLVLFGLFTGGIGFVCLIPLICILIPVFWAISIVLEQANAAIVLDDLSIIDGLQRGWRVCRENLGSALLMGLILGILSFVLGLILAIPFLVAVVPAFFAALAGTQELSTTPILIGLLCILAYMPVFLVLNGILTAYVQSAWALTYMRLSRPPQAAPLATPVNA